MAEQEVGNLAVRISLDSTGFQNGISGINKQLAVVQSGFKAASAGLGGFGNSSDQLRLKADSLSQQIELQKQKVAALNDAFNKSVETKGADAAATQNLQVKLNLAQAALSTMQTELTNTNRQIDIQSSRWTSLGDTLSSIGTRMYSVGKSMSSIGKSLSTTVTAPLVVIGTAAEKVAIDFEEGMAKVATIADTTTVSLDKLKQGVLDVSNQTGASTDDLNEALYQTISAGVKTADSVKFMGDSVKLAKGGFTDTTTAVDVLSTAVNAYGLKASEAATISDQLITTQNLGKTTVGELGQSLGNVIPIAASVNVGTKELFASLAELTKNGIKTDEAVTGLKGAYSAILKPSSEASKEAKTLGLNFSAAHLKSVGWAQFLEEVKQKTGGSGEAMSKLFGNVRALTAVMTLAGKGSSDFKDILGQMNNTVGATDAAFAKVQDTSGVKLKKAFNDIKNAGIQLGDALTPIAEKVAGAIEKLADKFKNLSPVQQEMIVKIGLVAAALGPVLVVIGSLIKNVGLIAGVFSKASIAIGEAGGIIEVLTGPIGITIAAIAGLVTVGVLLYKNWDTIKAKAQELWQSINKAFPGLKTTITKAWDAVKTATKTIETVFSEVWTGIKTSVNDAWGYIGPTITNGINKIAAFWKEIWPELKQLFVEVWDVIKVVLVPAVAGLYLVISAALGLIKGAWHDAWNVIKETFKLVWDGIRDLIKTYWDLISGIFKVALDVLTGHWSKAWTDMLSIFKNLWGDIKGLFGDMASDAVQWGKDFIQGLIDGITGMIGGVTNAVKNVATTIKSYLHFSTPDKGPLADYESWMPDFMGGLAAGIEKNKNLVKNAIGGLATDMSIGVQASGSTTGSYATGGGITIINQGTIVGSSGMSEFAKIVSKEIGKVYGLGTGGAF